jgi:hypothetical protein
MAEYSQAQQLTKVAKAWLDQHASWEQPTPINKAEPRQITGQGRIDKALAQNYKGALSTMLAASMEQGGVLQATKTVATTTTMQTLSNEHDSRQYRTH